MNGPHADLARLDRWGLGPKPGHKVLLIDEFNWKVSLKVPKMLLCLPGRSCICGCTLFPILCDVSRPRPVEGVCHSNPYGVGSRYLCKPMGNATSIMVNRSRVIGWFCFTAGRFKLIILFHVSEKEA